MLVYNNTITVSYRTGGLNGYNIKYCMDGYNKGLKVYNNNLIRPPFSGLTNDFDFSMELWNCRGGIEIYGNTMNGSIDMSGDNPAPCNDEGGYGFAAKIHHNTIGWDTWQDHEQMGVDIERAHTGGMYIYNNHFKKLTTPVKTYQGYDSRSHDIVEDIFIYYNLADGIGNKTSQYGTAFFATGNIPVDANGIIYRRIYIVNNTIIAGTGSYGTEAGINFSIAGSASNIVVKNNIIVGFGDVGDGGAIFIDGSRLSSFTNFTLQNNIFYQNKRNSVMLYAGANPSYAVNSGNITANPLHTSATDFHLQPGSPAIGKGIYSGYTTDYANAVVNNPPAIGAYEYGSAVVAPTAPVYQNSAVNNATPSVLEMTYSIALANIAPAASAFNVIVNSLARTVSSVVISGTKVQLTLSNAIKYGDIIVVSYTKPSANPLQTASGAQAISLVSQAVLNKVNAVAPVNPVYISSTIENATPALLEMTYNISLASIVPAVTSFSVIVNSSARTVSAIAVAGTKVRLTLASRIVSGDIVTVSYLKPAANYLQTSSAGTAASISNSPVINNCQNAAPVAILTSPVVNSSFTAPANISMTASATDTDGSVSLVEFFNGNTKIGSASAAPYSFTWNNVIAGSYSLTAVVTDNQNTKTVSSAISISVVDKKTTPNRHPFIHISNPHKGNSYVNLTTITIDAIASDPDGTVSKVEFYNGSERLVELTTEPYTYIWKVVVPGTYTITAIATDNLNDTTKSSPVEFEIAANVKYDANSEIVKLYPNPNSGHFSVEFLNPLKNDNCKIVITDMAGKQVYNGPVLKEEILKQFDLTDSRSGVYVMLIKDKDIIVTKKFIKN
jgi:uncharacterized repeat protein (TIGR02059 family)